jgi:hypothetical protein
MIRWANGWTTVRTRDRQGQLQPTRVGVLLGEGGVAVGLGVQVEFGPVAILTDASVEDLLTALEEQRVRLVSGQWGRQQ